MTGFSRTYITVWYCDNCHHGPLNFSLDTCCPNCHHHRCQYCTVQDIKTRSDSNYAAPQDSRVTEVEDLQSVGLSSDDNSTKTSESTPAAADSDYSEASKEQDVRFKGIYDASDIDKNQQSHLHPEKGADSRSEFGSESYASQRASQGEQKISEGLQSLQITDGTHSQDLQQGQGLSSELELDSGVSSPTHTDFEFKGTEIMDLEAIEKSYTGSVNEESHTQRRPDLMSLASGLQHLDSSASGKELSDNGSPKESDGRSDDEMLNLETLYHTDIEGHESLEDVQDHGVDHMHEWEDSQALEPPTTRESPEERDQLQVKDHRESPLWLSASKGEPRASVFQANQEGVEVVVEDSDSGPKTASDSTNIALFEEHLEPLIGSSEGPLSMGSTNRADIGFQMFQSPTFRTDTRAKDSEAVNRRSVSANGQEWTKELPYRYHGLAGNHRWLGIEDNSTFSHGALHSEATMSRYEPLLLATNNSESGPYTVEMPQLLSPTVMNAENDYDSDDMSNQSIQSICSDRISVASSSSSVSVGLDTRVVKELRDLFTNHDVLKPLYDVAILKTGPDRFQRNLRRLLVGYSRSLRKEAKQPTQREAVRLVRHAALNLSIHIANYMADKNGSRERKDKLPEIEENFSEDDLESDDADETLHTLDKVKSFMVSSAAFSEFCHGLRVWLNLEEIPSELVPVSDNGANQGKGEVLVKPLGPSADLPNVELTGEENTTARSVWLRIGSLLWKQYWNIASDLLQPNVSAGHVSISWTCRCGYRLRIEVPESRLQAATVFVKQAAGSNAYTITSRRPNEGSSASASSSSQASTHTGVPAGNSPGSEPHSPGTSPSDEEAETVTPPFIPTGTRKYLLLCVNTASLRGICQRKLVNVDVTNIEDDGELFQSVRNAYTTMRQTSWNPFLIPRTMYYVKFQLLFLRKSGEVVGPYQINSIPSLKEVLKQEYAFWPCPPDMGDLPMPPDIFMHAFLDPGNHTGTVAVQRLPKKLWAELRWDGQVHSHFAIPTGWGVYIIEGIHWGLVWWWAILVLIAVTILTVSWSALMDDVQGGTGLGQYCLAALAGLGSVCLWHYSAREIIS